MLQAVRKANRNHATACTANASPVPKSSHSTLNPVQVLDALSELYALLEDYAPSWYTQEYREMAEHALHFRRL